MTETIKYFISSIKFLLLHALFWVVLFAATRLIFIWINADKAFELALGDYFGLFAHGLIFDLSIAGYLSLLYGVALAFAAPFGAAKPTMKVCTVVSAVLAVLMVMLLPADAIVYSHWNNHFDATSLEILKTPEAVFDSTDNITVVLYLIAVVALSIGAVVLLRLMLRRTTDGATAKPKGILPVGIVVILMLVVSAAMIIPIRAGFGRAPLNPGRAYFSQKIFANHAALNPAWNFLYSLKRVKGNTTAYRFMDEAEAHALFDQMMHAEGNFPAVLKNNRPNIIVVLLESFSAHAIEYLGGVNATPTIKSLLPQSIAFSNVLAASDRSGKGLVAVLCGYPVQPTVSIIQYPNKAQTLPFVPKKLREAGYDDQVFLYGGDINFNNFNALVTLAGFSTVVTQDDFESWQLGEKWGAHDRYAFDRLLSIADGQKEPFFDFFFTLSSHEPFTVPMKKQFDDKYLNSVYYTDMCLGKFIDEARQRSWWDNTLLVLIADHGHGGPNNVGNDDTRRFKIPMIFTGGALAVTDTIVEKHGTQTDLAATLLNQLGIDAEEFSFSKNLLDKSVKGFSFFDFNDGFGYADNNTYQVFDNPSQRYIRFDKNAEPADTLSARAMLQVMSEDYLQR